MASSPSKLSLKLLIDTKGRRVLFAEAGKDFVDFLFNIPSLPLGTVIKLLSKESMAGCIGNLYQSIDNLSETYMLQKLDKNTLLEPKIPIHIKKVSPLLLPNVVPCNNGVAQVSVFGIQSSSSGEGLGYVKEAVTYMVMDDLDVKPMFSNSIISILDKFNIKDYGDLEERIIDFGFNEATNLLKASLQSREVLTSLFLDEMDAK